MPNELSTHPILLTNRPTPIYHNTIGCELEVTLELQAVVAARQRPPTDLAEFANLVVSHYERTRKRGQIAMQSDVDGGAEQDNRWTSTDDVTIETSSPKKLWEFFFFYNGVVKANSSIGPIEGVSRIIYHRSDAKWMRQITALFGNLERLCSIKANESCGFHVHFAPAGGWDLERLKPLCRALLFMEPAFEVILPAKRRGNEYAKSNCFDNPGLRGKTGQAGHLQSHRQL